MYKKILVTGATGFLGGSLAAELLKQGYHVKATGRNTEKLCKLSHKNLQTVIADLSEPEHCAEAVKDCDAVIHCAALAAPWGKKIDFLKSNVMSTDNLASQAIKHKVKRFVHISTPSIYMGMKKKLNIKEDDPLPEKFISDYAYTKYEAEKLIDGFTKEGLNTITLRPQGLFGPGDTVLLPRLLAANEKTGIPVFKEGRHLIDLTYIDNVVDAVILSLNASDICRGQKYNITNNHPIVFIDFINTVLAKLNMKFHSKKIPLWLGKLIASALEIQYRQFEFNSEPPLTRYAVEALSNSRTLDISKAIQELNYKPLVTIDEGIDRFVFWWKSKYK